MPDLDSEALDFRPASELFKTVRSLSTSTMPLRRIGSRKAPVSESSLSY